MEPWLMWTLAGGFTLLPFVLMMAFNGANEADSRGRRVSARWHS